MRTNRGGCDTRPVGPLLFSCGPPIVPEVAALWSLSEASAATINSPIVRASVGPLFIALPYDCSGGHGVVEPHS